MPVRPTAGRTGRSALTRIARTGCESRPSTTPRQPQAPNEHVENTGTRQRGISLRIMQPSIDPLENTKRSHHSGGTGAVAAFPISASADWVFALLSCTIPDGWLYSAAAPPRTRPKATCFALRALTLDQSWPLAGTPAGAAGRAGQTEILARIWLHDGCRAPLRIRFLRSLRTRASAGFLERFYRKLKELWRRGWDSNPRYP
jgi:hypothetical protein